MTTRPVSLLYKLAAPIAENYVIGKRFQKTTFSVLHTSTSPFLSSSQFSSKNDTYMVTVPPTAVALDEASLYRALVQCFDGQEKNFVMDLRDHETRAKMQYLHYWSEKRLKFVLGHEMAHIANDDFGKLKDVKRKMLTQFGKLENLRQLHFEEEHEADSLATNIDLETALGGVEHMLKLQGFFNLIYECSVRNGNKMSFSEFQEARSRTHPLETDRLERMYRIIAAKFDVTQADAKVLAMENAGEDILSNVSVKTASSSGEYVSNKAAMSNIDEQTLKTAKAAMAKIDEKTLKNAEDMLKNLAKKQPRRK